MGSILIVEDDAVLGSVLDAAFRREWTVELAESADEALRVFRAATGAPPELVLTDKNMPGMDGMALVRALRQIDPTLGIVVMTAYGTVESARESIDWGVDAYIEKPFPDLMLLVRELGLLTQKVIERRKRVQAERGVRLEIVCASSDQKRRVKLREPLGRAEKLGWCNSLDELCGAVERGECTVAVVDCPSLGIDADLAAARLDSLGHAAVIIIAEGLEVPEIARLIDLHVRALCDRSLDDLRFSEMLIRALERIRTGS